MNSRKKIVVVDDDETITRSLVLGLKLRGFDAEGATDVTGARNLITRLGHEIDVMVLDMRLEDNQYPNISGAHLGFEARETIRKWPPEFLILSGFKQSEYYEAALQLDVAAYLVKGNVDDADVIRHVRSLCLRRALSFEREEIDERISEIAGASLSSTEAVADFCRRLLATEMQACTGAPSVFLLTDEGGTQNCGGDASVPVGYDEAYAKIQALVQGEINNSDPFVFDKNEVSAPSSQQGFDIYGRLHGAAFLPLFNVHGLRLSIGIAKSDDPHQKLPEDPVKLAKILIAYLRPAIIEHLLRILSLLAKSSAEREALLRHTSRFCRWVGQEQLAILDEANTDGELDAKTECFQKFKGLSEDLRLTGEFLSPLALRTKKNDSDETPCVTDTIKDVWREITEQFDAEGILFEMQDEDLSFPVARADLFLSALRVLQWMALRKDRTVSGNQRISVQYAKDNDSARMVFTDQSRRLGENLRRMLFEPFTQANLIPPAPREREEDSRPGLYLPLFLAKMLVEVKYKGSLQDRTDELETENGHRFVMTFPIGEGSSNTDSVMSSKSMSTP